MFVRPDLARARSLRVPTTAEWGVAVAVVAAAVSGLAIYLNAFAVRQLPDAAVYTTLKNGVAATVLVGIGLGTGALRRDAPVIRRNWRRILVVGVVGGSIPFILFFTGLGQASAPSAAFIQKTLFIWVAFLAVYVATWFAALERAPASVVTSVLVLGAVVTGGLTAVSKGAAPSPPVVGGYVLIVVAAGALALWSIRSARSIQAEYVRAASPGSAIAD